MTVIFGGRISGKATTNCRTIGCDIRAGLPRPIRCDKIPCQQITDLGAGVLQNHRLLVALAVSVVLSAPLQARAQNGTPSSAQLMVSTEVQEDIAIYLRNATNSSRFWALAISTDGTRSQRTSCPKTDTSGPIDCYYGVGHPSQERTDRRSLKDCGSDCILVYSGITKTFSGEIVPK